MGAYVIVDTRIENPDAYEEYKSKARPIVEKYGGRYIVRGGAMKVLESDLWTPTRIVVIEFPDMQAADRFYQNDEYQPVKLLRHANAKCTLLVVDGT